MPSIATQTSPIIRSPSQIFSHGLPTPPLTPSDCTPVPQAPSPTASVHYVTNKRRPKHRQPFALSIDSIQINMPPAPSPAPPKPQMKSVGCQAGEPQIAKSKAGPWMRRWLTFWSYAKPTLQILAVIPMFFIERTGFGISLNGLFASPRK